MKFILLLLAIIQYVTSFTPCIQTATTTGSSLYSSMNSAPVSSTPTNPAPTNPAPSPMGGGGMTSNQEKYGNEMDLPDTYVRCGRCAASFALALDDLGSGKGRYVECSVCSHSWFQSRDRLFNLNEGRELVPLPQAELDRIASNIKNNRDPDYIGDTKFFVGNLDFGVEESDIREIFAAIGEVGEVSLVLGPDGRSRGFAFVTMMDKADLNECLGLDQTELKGRAINVKEPN